MLKCVVAVDPGISGGVAVLTSPTHVHCGFTMPVWKPKNKNLVQAFDLNEKLRAAFAAIGQGPEGLEFVIEEVAAMPKQGVVTTFQFGRALGAAEAIAGTFGCPIYWIPARRWKLGLHIGKHKTAAMDHATSVFGTKARDRYWRLRKQDGIAEAALLGHYHFRRS